VIARLVLSRRPDLAERLRRVVTLGTPHRGTAAARGIPLLPEVRALKRRSELWRSLPELSELLPHAKIASVAGTHDTIVYPVSTALIPGADHVVLDGVGHAGLLTRPHAIDAVLTHLDG
jgi:pimeloyl-ACP methyl ester carboxylesterase